MVKQRCVRTRVNSQFHPMVSTSGRDCGVATTEELIRHGTRGAIQLGPQKTRVRMGNLHNWTNPLEVGKAVDSIDKEARRRGMKGLKYKRAGRWARLASGTDIITAGASKASIIARAKRGELIHLVVDYAVVNDKYPWLSGSKTFRGLHSIYVGGHDVENKLAIRKRGGQYQLLYGDPTWNRVGTPKGMKWVKLSTIWDISNGAWSSKGSQGWVGGSVACADLLPDDPVLVPPYDPADPVDPCADELLDMEQQRDEALATLEDARDTIEELRTKRISRKLVEQLNEIADRMDALVPDVEGVDDTAIVEGTEAPEAP